MLNNKYSQQDYKVKQKHNYNKNYDNGYLCEGEGVGDWEEVRKMPYVFGLGGDFHELLLFLLFL